MKAPQIVRIALLALGLASASCGTVREGTGTSFLIVDAIEFSEIGDSQSFIANAISDVETVVDEVPTTFNDLARVTFRLGLKDPGPAGNPNGPTQNQWITINRYHVRYFRADGRNVQGVDVPYEFDGAFTVTVGSTNPQPVFTYVRHAAKNEAPLRALKTNGIIMTLIVEFTFYGQDQSGHEVSATARTSVEVGNFGDPE
jgi:hypothetical protein